MIQEISTGYLQQVNINNNVNVNPQPQVNVNQININTAPVIGNNYPVQENDCPLCALDNVLANLPQEAPIVPPMVIIQDSNPFNGSGFKTNGLLNKISNQIGELIAKIQELFGNNDEIKDVDINDPKNIFTPKENKHDKKIEKLASKLDKIGIDTEIVDKFQDLLTGENYADNLTNKEKKAIDKIVKQIEKLTKKGRLTANDKAKIEDLVNQAIAIADKSKVDDDEPAPAPAPAPAPGQDKKVDQKKVDAAWAKIEKAMVNTTDSDKVKALKQYTEHLSDEEFATLIKDHKELILNKIFKNIDDGDTFNYIENRLRTAANKKGAEIEPNEYVGLDHLRGGKREQELRNHISKCIDEVLK